MVTTPGVTFRMFALIKKLWSNINLGNKISVLIKRKVTKAIKALHTEFDLKNDIRNQTI